PRQQRAIEQRLQAVMLQHRRATHLAHESASKSALDGPAGLVGTETEQEGRSNAQLFEQADQARYTFVGATIRIHVDLQSDPGHLDEQIWIRSTAAACEPAQPPASAGSTDLQP